MVEIPKGTKFIKAKYYYGFEYVQCKIVMKGYQKRSKQDFEDVKAGKALSFESLEKIGAMVAKNFKDGPKMRSISRCIRTEENKRRHINGITYPHVLDEDIESFSLENED